MKQTRHPIILAMTGASGAAYGLRLLQVLLDAEVPVYLLVSQAARMVLDMETELEVPAGTAEMQRYFCQLYDCRPELLTVFSRQDWSAPIASGSHKARAMVVCPCTAGSLAAIAHGISDNLLERAADVMLKEQRKLILVIRETPLSPIHLENMLKLSKAGATIMPANPGFYQNPIDINDLVDFMVARILDHLGLDHTLMTPWGETKD